ncbi:MAG: PAS domain S-box protein, partial [Verrucomicrobiota bacterium]
PEETVTVEFRFRHRNGSWINLEAVGQSRLGDPDIGAVIVNSRDITARKRTEQDLRESEQRFRDLFENSPDAIFVEDAAGNVLDANQAACRLHGVGREKLVGMNGFNLVPEERRRETMMDFQRLVDGEITRVEAESLSADGRVTPVEIHSTSIQYQGRSAVLLHVRDISVRKHTEAALRSSEMLFRSVWENSVDGMRLTDEQGYIVAVNDAFCKLVGMSRAELEGNPFTVIYAESEQPGRILKKYQQRFRDRVIERQIERCFTLHNGTVIVLEHTNSFVDLRGQPPMLLGSFRDVTAQKRLEDQLRHSQKMDAIGQLAGGVAHDFNNILTVIHGHASLLLSSGGLPGAAGKSAQQIVQAAERAASLTRQLLMFSRRQVMQQRRLDLNEVVGNMTKMLGRILGEDIALEMRYWPEPPLIRADAGMMEQVLLNLTVNARDAMPRGGQLYIGISVEDIGTLHTSRHPDAHPGQFVCLTVTDSGTGIPPEILGRIFEPFFTTKEVGKGTGLGLATVYGVVKQHQGWIEVESELGRGATFRVYLPPADKSVEDNEEAAAEIVVRGGNETILVVEDEPPVRELVCSLLKGHGYRVLGAESGVRALEVWRDHKDEIALLLTDVVMPDQINGRELAEKLWAERPGLKVIFTSGYSSDVVGKDWVLRHGLRYVQKPYHPRKLALAVRDCLDATDLRPAI